MQIETKRIKSKKFTQNGEQNKIVLNSLLNLKPINSNMLTSNFKRLQSLDLRYDLQMFAHTHMSYRLNRDFIVNNKRKLRVVNNLCKAPSAIGRSMPFNWF